MQRSCHRLASTIPSCNRSPRAPGAELAGRIITVTGATQLLMAPRWSSRGTGGSQTRVGMHGVKVCDGHPSLHLAESIGTSTDLHAPPGSHHRTCRFKLHSSEGSICLSPDA